MAACVLLKRRGSKAPRRELGAGGWGSVYSHWTQRCSKGYFPPSPGVAGFTGDSQDISTLHYLVTSASAGVLRRADDTLLFSAQGINPDYYYSHHYIKERIEPWAFEGSDSGRWGRKLLNSRFDGFADEMTILPEPVLPVGEPGTKIPCAAWQKVFNKCVKRHENAVAGKCEYLRCKLYECRTTQN
ncbi:unnamed protein product [Linum tenue]|uniref:Uncharacterized protein n=1 Tax=Linum tenue TaxID=586396 RepID=A0AAV0NNR8_9ROSI|nr:unnamed protein product [Linum tenue]